ncbi:MAG: hypothetical protein EXR20_00790 [Bacteroidetes bacterium]|nr:hypothetical protein [Bacteroidota bacterium]PHX83028.1 MAG: hypothetical protein CK539_01640 [Flavobacteriales bacterium]
MRKEFLLLFLFFICETSLLACDCKIGPISELTIENEELIFLGKVVAISGCDVVAKVNFQVTELYRGKCFEETAVEFDCSSDCLMSFVPGQTWLIFANYKKYGEPKVKFCSYSRQQFELNQADYNSAVHGMGFQEERDWLKIKFGLQALNINNKGLQQHHTNIRPAGLQFLWYIGLGLVVLAGLYFIGRKFF